MNRVSPVTGQYAHLPLGDPTAVGTHRTPILSALEVSYGVEVLDWVHAVFGMAVGDLLASLAGVDVEQAAVLGSHLGGLQKSLLAAGVDRVGADSILYPLGRRAFPEQGIHSLQCLAPS